MHPVQIEAFQDELTKIAADEAAVPSAFNQVKARSAGFQSRLPTDGGKAAAFLKNQAARKSAVGKASASVQRSGVLSRIGNVAKRVAGKVLG